MTVFLLFFSEFSSPPSILSCSQTAVPWASASILPRFANAMLSSRDTWSFTIHLLPLTKYPTKKNLNNKELKLLCSAAQQCQEHSFSFLTHSLTLLLFLPIPQDRVTLCHGHSFHLSTPPSSCWLLVSGLTLPQLPSGAKMAATAPGIATHTTASKGIQKRTLSSQLSFYEGEKPFPEALAPRKISLKLHWPAKFLSNVYHLFHSQMSPNLPLASPLIFFLHCSSIHWALLSARHSAKYSTNIILCIP